jgi:hypothetical protein
MMKVMENVFTSTKVNSNISLVILHHRYSHEIDLFVNLFLPHLEAFGEGIDIFFVCKTSLVLEF